LASFVSLQGSSVNLLRSGSRQTDNLSFPQYKRNSTDDAESSRGVANSSSSGHSTELRVPKISLFSKLKSRASKPNLRHEADVMELVPSSHRSLHPPVPPLPMKERSATQQNGVTVLPPTVPTLSVPPPTKEKRDKGKRKATNAKNPPMPPSKYPDTAMEKFSSELSLNPLQGIVGLDKDTMAGIVDFDSSSSSNHHHTSSPFSSAGISSSLSEINPLPTHSQMFSNPWKESSSAPEKWTSNSELRKVSPTSMAPPYMSSSFSLPSSSSHGCSGSPSSPEQWVPPESWAVVKPHDAYDRLGHGDNSETQGSSSEGEVVGDDVSSMARWKDDRNLRNGFRKNTASSATSLISEMRRPTGALVRLPFLEPRSSNPYHFRIYRQTGEYHVVALTLSTTVQDFSEKIKSRLSPQDQRIQHNLYLKEQGRGTDFHSTSYALT